MTNLPQPSSLHNRYYGFRHGQSEANVRSLIISDPKVGTKRFGLSKAGREQVVESAMAHRAVLAGAALYSSDFLRTKQTAEIALDAIGRSESIRFDPRLRERFFGTFDGGSNEAYHLAWKADRVSPERDDSGVEPVIHVAKRVSEFIKEVEKKVTDANVVLFGHGDPLQITEAWLQGDDLKNHTAHRFETAEMRMLTPAGPR
jgi:broad specificity phosphatase PhoE